MKKRSMSSKLTLRKDTLRTLGQDDLARIAGGTSGHPICDEHTEDQVCIETTIAPGCVHHDTVGCYDTQGCTNTCNLACTDTCTLGCPTVGSTTDGC